MIIRPPFFAWICLISLLLAGCGAHAGATEEPTTPKKSSVTTATVAPYATAVVSSRLATSTPQPTASPTAGVTATAQATSQPQPTSHASVAQQIPGRLLNASLSPASVAPGALLSARVQTAGNVGRVDLYLGSGAPSGPAPLTFSLTPLGGGVWGASGAAPSAPGQYHFTVGIYVNGKRTISDDDAWNVTVTGGSSGTGSAQTLPPDIPLAPPFSYGSPTPAVFNAAGQTINGSQVTSTTRPDIAPSVVSQWYEVHLPRAGWSVDQSTIPAAGATSFTMVGTSGNRVCVVQYSGYTVHIFFGNTSG